MQDKLDIFTYDQSNVLYDALTLYLQDTEARIDYRTRRGLQVSALQDRRTIAVTMRDEAQRRMIEARVARQDKILQDKEGSQC